MVATTDCDRSKALSPANKVSKPQMEKKRRARINQCLDQLKSLLESHYSTTIRKRKLEKADILELTVRHLKHLQKTQKFSSAAAESEYQPGFRSCVSDVRHYLLTADHVSGADRWTLSQLTTRLSARQPQDSNSTMDSTHHARSQGARTLAPCPASGPEESSTASGAAHSCTARGPASGAGHRSQLSLTAADKSHCEVLNDVWRPW